VSYSATKIKDGLQDSARASGSCGEGGDRREEPTNHLHTCFEGKVIVEIRDFLECGGGILGGDHRARCFVFPGRGFGTRCYFLLGLPRTRLKGCCRFVIRLLRPGRFPGRGNFRLRGCLRAPLRRGIWIWFAGWSGGSVDDTPPRNT